MKFFLVLATFMLLGIGFFLGELGVVPGLSDALGTREPEDLGVVVTPKALEGLKTRYQASLSLPDSATVNEIPKPEQAAPPVPRSARIKVSSAELSAWLNARPFKAIPLRDIQARSTQGGIELSGHLDRDKLATFAEAVAERNAAARALIEQLEELDGAPVYLKLTGGIEQGQLRARLESLRVGALPLPDQILRQVSDREIKANVLGREGLSIERLSFEPDHLNFEGMVPLDFPVQDAGR